LIASRNIRRGNERPGKHWFALYFGGVAGALEPISPILRRSAIAADGAPRLENPPVLRLGAPHLLAEAAKIRVFSFRCGAT
jgi:hypothetical protein